MIGRRDPSDADSPQMDAAWGRAARPGGMAPFVDSGSPLPDHLVAAAGLGIPFGLADDHLAGVWGTNLPHLGEFVKTAPA